MEPVVSSFNGDSVEVQITNANVRNKSGRAQARVEADSVAEDICARGPNKNAEYVSTRQTPAANQYLVNDVHLYLCLNEAG